MFDENRFDRVSETGRTNLNRNHGPERETGIFGGHALLSYAPFAFSFFRGGAISFLFPLHPCPLLFFHLLSPPFFFLSVLGTPNKNTRRNTLIRLLGYYRRQLGDRRYYKSAKSVDARFYEWNFTTNHVYSRESVLPAYNDFNLLRLKPWHDDIAAKWSY